MSSDSNNSSVSRAVQNGARQQQPTYRVSNATVTSTTDTQAQKITTAVPRAPSSNVPSAAQSPNVSTAGSESKAPTIPAKGDPSSSFTLQFGSISPGFVNGMQIPARTSSAPPNLDEQKKYQARLESFRAGPTNPVPSIPKQHLPKKDSETLHQPNAGEAHLLSKSKRNAQVSVAPPMTQTQKPSAHPIPGMHMQLPFHQMQVPVQYGGPNPQIQSQAMSGPSLQQMPMPIPLPIGNSPVQQAMFVSGLQPHPMQSQGMMNQGLNFSSQMGGQLPTQLGNMGMNMAPQFSQPQAGIYSGSRKTVKITHPETHEELRLDGSPGPRSLPNAPPQSQPVPSFPTSHPMNYYPNFYPPVSSVPFNNTQVPPTSQPHRYYNQVTVKPAVGSRVEKGPLPPTSSLSVGKAESLRHSRLCGEDSVNPKAESLRHSRLRGEDSFNPHKEIEPGSLSSLPPSKPGLETSSTSAALTGPVNVENDVPTNLDFASAPMVSATSSTSCANEAINGVVVPDSTKDEQKKLGSKGQQDQAGRQLIPPSSLPSQLPDTEAVEAKSTLSRTNFLSEIAKEPLSTTVTPASGASILANEGDTEGKTRDASKSLGTEVVNSRASNPETMGREERGEAILSKTSKPDGQSMETCLRSLSLESPKITIKIEKSSDKEVTSTSADDVKMADNDSATGLSAVDADVLLSVPDSKDTRETTVAKCTVVDQESAPVLVSSPIEGPLIPENGDSENNNGGIVSTSSLTDKVVSDVNLAKSVVIRGKKKKKELYRKAEAAGTSFDLYNAYKGPEEKKESVTSAEGTQNPSTISMKQTSADISQENAIPSEKSTRSKVEPDDWEDAAEISTQLKTSENEKQGFDGDGNELMTKRYSRDFLLKFVEQCMELPDGFEVTYDIADALMVSSVNDSRESYPSPGRNIERPVGNSRPDRRGIGLGDEWNKFPGPHMSGRGDMQTDVGYLGNMVGIRPGQGGNLGVLRNPRVQAPVQYAVGGILSGQMQSLGPQGSLQRNHSDSDRWQRASGFQKGLMPYPEGPAMHKAEKKYEVGKVTDEEQAKQRQLKGILNKLTPQNFEKLFEQVKQLKIDNVITLSGVISQIFDKALMEPTFCQMYANFCFHLAMDLPDLSVDNERITFKRLLLNKCQEEFERGEREEEEANKEELEGESKQTAEEREEKRLQTRRRMLGNIRLIGELYKKRMLTERIMHECINKLLGQYQNPDEENIEALCKLMSTIGEMIDHSKAKEFMDAYFDIMAQLSNNMKLSSRVRFMLKDSIDLRKNKWQQRRKVEGPKKIEEVHRDAAQERHAQSSRLGRAPSMGSSVRRAPPMEYSPRTPNMYSSPSPHMGGFRGGPPQNRGYNSQDARIDERHSFENRTMSLPQRPMGDDSITLGPQGGLARGMAFRGQPSAHSIPYGEMPSPGDARRIEPGLNKFNSMKERTTYVQREDPMARYVPSINEQPHQQKRSNHYGNREIRNTDRSFDKTMPTSPSAQGGPPTIMQNVFSEERLQEKSMAAIKEFYSARDEKEVALCIKDLNAPSFYPSMISTWVTYSFERKDMERDLLAKLLINLTKLQDGIISKDQLIKGFESVLTVLEDAINDAPKAAEFLGRIFAKVILENVVSLSEIGRLIYEGGDEQGQLVETGHAAEVIGSILETIKSEKGDFVLNEIRTSSNLRLENFRPPAQINN